MKADNQAGKRSKDLVTFGLVGVGRWGSCYLSTLKGMEGINLGMVVSRNSETRHKVPSGCDVFEDWRAALEPGRLDGLILATPPAARYEMTRACIDADLPVLVEKPFTQDLQQAVELEQAARQKDSLVMVDHTHIFSSAYETLKQRAEHLEGPLRICSIGGNQGPFREHTSVLWDWGAHDVALCMDLIGQTPLTVHAGISASRLTEEGAGMVIDVEIGYANGAHAELKFGNLMPEKKRVFEVKGANGGLVYDDLAVNKLVEYGPGGSMQKIDVSSIPPLSRAVAVFRDNIVSGNRQHASLPLGVRVVEILAHIESKLTASSGMKV
jgi:predicted dehydrogenase